MTLKPLERTMASYFVLGSYTEICIWPLALAVSVAKLHNNEEKRNNWLRDGRGPSSPSCWSRISTAPLCMACVKLKWHVVWPRVPQGRQLTRNFHFTSTNKTKSQHRYPIGRLQFLCQTCPSPVPGPPGKFWWFFFPIFRGASYSPWSGVVYKPSLLPVSIMDRKYMQQ